VFTQHEVELNQARANNMGLSIFTFHMQITLQNWMVVQMDAEHMEHIEMTSTVRNNLWPSVMIREATSTLMEVADLPISRTVGLNEK
jgi:hypothetical protein